MLDYVIFVWRLALFSLFNLLLLGVAYVLTQRLGRGWPRSERLSAIVLIFFAQIVVYQLALGALKILTYPNLWIVGGLCSITLLFFLRRDLTFPDDLRVSPDGATLLWQRVRRFPYPLLFLVGLALALEFALGLRHPPLNGDDLGYHLPLAVSWFQSHSLWVTHPPFWFYPGTSELIDLWLLLPFRDDFFLALQNWPFLLLSLLSLYGIARQQRLSVRWSACGAVLFVGVLMLHNQFDSQNNDMVSNALFLVSLLFVIRYSASNTWGAWALASVSGGLMLGTKYYGAYYLATLGCVYLFLAIGRKRWSVIVRDALLMGGIAFIFGGFWYVRNWIIAGNPLTPVEIQIGPIKLFPGYEAYKWQLTSTLLAHRREPIVWQLLWEALLKSGWLAPLTLPCYGVSLLFCAWKAIKKDLSRLEVLLNVLLPVVLTAVYLTTPLLVENNQGTLNLLKLAYTPVRYGFTLWAMAGVTLVWLLSRLEITPDSFGAKILVTVVALFPYVWLVPTYAPFTSGFFDFQLETPGVVLGCIACVSFVAFERFFALVPAPGERAFRWFDRNRRRLWLISGAVVGMGVLVLAFFFHRYRVNNDALFYTRHFFPTYPAAQPALAQSKGRVVLTGWYTPYFWYGEDFRNQIFICSWESAPALEACTRRYAADTLIVAKDTPENFRETDSLAETASDWLKLTYQDDYVSMYRVLP